MTTNTEIADVQAYIDNRNLAVNRVGIKSLKHPVIVEDINEDGSPLTIQSVATFDMFVALPADCKGTHMSRFIALLNEQECVLSMAKLPTLLDNLPILMQDYLCFYPKRHPYQK